jgi:2-phospho-L-lactate/phosphoenolpyruvate guanylyltransferase
VPIAAVIPIRSFETGKARLGSVLSVEERRELGGEMAERTVAAAEGAGMLPAVVTGDGGVARWAARRGLPVIPESGQGLDSAARQGVDWAGDAGLDWVVLHSDLPLIRSADLAHLVGPIDERRPVIAPSSDGGTSALSSPYPPRFSYGPGSFHRHLAAIGESLVVTVTGLLQDLDSPADLQSALSHVEGAWLSSVVQTEIGR